MADRRRPPQAIERMRTGADLPKTRQLSSDDRVAMRQASRRRVILWRGVVILVVMAFGWRFFTPIQRVSLIAPPESEASKVLDAYLTGSTKVNGLINGSNLEKYMTSGVSDAVRTSVQHNVLLSSLKVEVITQQPAIRWQTAGIQYVVSDHGIVLAPSNDAYQELPIVYDEANVVIAEKEQAAPSDFVRFVTELRTESQSRSLEVREHHIRTSTRELTVIIEGRDYAIRFDTGRGAGEQLDELLRLEGYFQSIQRSAREYVDLRIPGRAYWK